MHANRRRPCGVDANKCRPGGPPRPGRAGQQPGDAKEATLTTPHASTGPDGDAAIGAPIRVVLGVMGGIGAGKSHVARRAAALAPGTVVDADAIAHEALRRCAADGTLADALGAEFVQDGKPDVRALGARVFQDPALLRRLERLVHPFVHSAIKAAVADFRAGAGTDLLVLDVPLLIEVGLDRQCDALWYVDTPDDVRAERAGQRGLTLEQIHLREAFQSPRERKRARADLVIRNDVDDAELERQVLAGLAGLGLHPAGADADAEAETPTHTPENSARASQEHVP